MPQFIIKDHLRDVLKYFSELPNEEICKIYNYLDWQQIYN